MYGRPIRDVMITLNGFDNIFYIIYSSRRRCSKQSETCREMDPSDQEDELHFRLILAGKIIYCRSFI